MRDVISVGVQGLSSLERQEAELGQLPRRFVVNLTADLARSIGGKVRSRKGRLAGSWRGHALTDTTGVVETTGTPYGRASGRGAYIRARPGRVLAFRDRSGRMVFRKWVRLAPGNWVGRPGDRKNGYITRGLRDRRQVARAALQRTLAE